MGALYATKRSEKGGGYAGVELHASSFEASPSIAGKASAQKVSVPEAEVSVPGTTAGEPVCVLVPWSGDVNELFEQMVLGGTVYNGDSEVEIGLVATTLHCISQTGCCCASETDCCCATLLPGCDLLSEDGQTFIASAVVAEPDHTRQPGTTSFPVEVVIDDAESVNKSSSVQPVESDYSSQDYRSESMTFEIIPEVSPVSAAGPLARQVVLINNDDSNAKVFTDDVNQLFEQLDLSEVEYQGEPKVGVALVASMSNTIATVRKYQPI